MKNQTVKLIQTFFLFNRLAWFDGNFETNCEKKPGIKCMDFRFLPHAKNINSFWMANLRKYNVNLFEKFYYKK